MRARRHARAALEWSPRPPDLDAAPELAVLAATRATAEIAVAALLAANPELGAGDDSPLPICALAARRVIDDVCRLRRAIDDYRGVAALAEIAAAPGDDDIPF
jgi:hypothetical protein